MPVNVELREPGADFTNVLDKVQFVPSFMTDCHRQIKELWAGEIGFLVLSPSLDPNEVTGFLGFRRNPDDANVIISPPSPRVGPSGYPDLDSNAKGVRERFTNTDVASILRHDREIPENTDLWQIPVHGAQSVEYTGRGKDRRTRELVGLAHHAGLLALEAASQIVLGGPEGSALAIRRVNKRYHGAETAIIHMPPTALMAQQRAGVEHAIPPRLLVTEANIQIHRVGRLQSS